MTQVEIWHNPRCSKSRQTLALLQEQGVEPLIRDYQKEPPSVDELRTMLDALGMEPGDVVRRKEALFKEVVGDREPSAEEWLEILHQYPKLIERPIVRSGDRAVIGRPPERILELFGNG